MSSTIFKASLPIHHLFPYEKGRLLRAPCTPSNGKRPWSGIFDRSEEGKRTEDSPQALPIFELSPTDGNVMSLWTDVAGIFSSSFVIFKKHQSLTRRWAISFSLRFLSLEKTRKLLQIAYAHSFSSAERCSRERSIKKTKWHKIRKHIRCWYFIWERFFRVYVFGARYIISQQIRNACFFTR